MTSEDKTACRTPAEGRDGVTNIPTWKFDLIRGAILSAVGIAGPEGMRFSDLKGAVQPQLEAKDLERLGSLGWHVTCVKLELEVRREVVRLPGSGPQRLILGQVHAS